jgi:hypothetical protein
VTRKYVTRHIAAKTAPVHWCREEVVEQHGLFLFLPPAARRSLVSSRKGYCLIIVWSIVEGGIFKEVMPVHISRITRSPISFFFSFETPQFGSSRFDASQQELTGSFSPKKRTDHGRT